MQGEDRPSWIRALRYGDYIDLKEAEVNNGSLNKDGISIKVDYSNRLSNRLTLVQVIDIKKDELTVKVLPSRLAESMRSSVNHTIIPFAEIDQWGENNLNRSKPKKAWKKPPRSNRTLSEAERREIKERNEKRNREFAIRSQQRIKEREKREQEIMENRLRRLAESGSEGKQKDPSKKSTSWMKVRRGLENKNKELKNNL